jgi:glycerophosphoryl diester phosphodiesterase
MKMIHTTVRVFIATAWVCSLSAVAEETTMTARAFFSKPLYLGAHRGGMALWPENTLEAYRNAYERWPDVLLEGDLRMTSDGVLVLMHDATVDRTTDGRGAVADKSLAEIKALDAGFRFSTDGGATYPYRGKGVRVPTFAEVLEALPQARFEFEMKEGPNIVAETVRIIREHHAEERVLLASFNPVYIAELRRTAPDLAACYDFTSAMELLTHLRQGDLTSYTPVFPVLSVTWELESKFKITPEEIQAIRARGILYQVHTINAKDAMLRRLREGVDSILSDNPSLLAEAVAEWRKEQEQAHAAAAR